MEDSYDESDFIQDDYSHPDPAIFYCVTRVPGKGVSESEFEYFQFGCDCSDSQCTIENNCSCLKYGTNYNGRLLTKEKLENVPVFECNAQCSCFKDLLRKPCPNRNVQYGPLDGLEIFDTGPKGLGLRRRKSIRSGSFICEYAGEVIGLEEAKKRQKTRRDMNYIFILREFTGNKLSGVTCVDPTVVGNIGRYINHSCQPNAAIVPIRVNNTVPWLCVFALRDIQENEEICYDYSGRNENPLNGEMGPERKPCLCNAPGCKQFLPFEDV